VTRSASVGVTPGHSATLRLAGGLRVDVPAHAVTGNGTLSAAVRSASVAAPHGMKLTGPVYDLRLAGTVLAAQVKLTIPVPRPSGQGATAGPGTALLAYYNQASGQWQPVSAIYHPAAGTITASTGHLSTWSVLQLAGQQVLDNARRTLKSFLGAVTISSPSCPDTGQLASAGVTVTADSGDLVKWCADDSNGATVLRIVDKRGYAIEVSYPAGWPMTRPGHLNPVTQSILSGLPALSLRAGGPNVQTAIISGGQETDITPQPGASGIVLAAPSAEGIIIDALTYAASTLTMTYGDIPGAAPTPESTAKAIAAAFGDASCVAKMDSVIQNSDVSTAEAAGALFRSFTDIAAGCLAGLWPGAYGLTGGAATFVTGTLLWLADGLNGVINDSQAAVDSALYWHGYHITVRSARAQPWTGSRVTITPGSLGDVRIGMTMRQAAAAAGEQLTLVADRIIYPLGRNGNPVYGALSGDARGPDGTVACLSAVLTPNAPAVTTPQGFALGGTTTQLKTVYGSSLRFMPAPPNAPVLPAYMVSYPNGHLVFTVNKGTVVSIFAGPGVLPTTVLC
jgi:hypothetical protein